MATVVARPGVGVEAATVVATGRHGCDGEGVACVCAKEMGVTLM